MHCHLFAQIRVNCQSIRKRFPLSILNASSRAITSIRFVCNDNFSSTVYLLRRLIKTIQEVYSVNYKWNARNNLQYDHSLNSNYVLLETPFFSLSYYIKSPVSKDIEARYNRTARSNIVLPLLNLNRRSDAIIGVLFSFIIVQSSASIVA